MPTIIETGGSGTPKLTGTAVAGDVKAGETFYNTDAKTIETGTFEAQSKTVTAGTSASSVSPDSGKYLSEVTVNPTPSQSKTITASREKQTVSPDSGYLLSSVVVNKYPNASGKYTFPADSTGATYDMGTTNNLRYVNASNVYAKGKADGVKYKTVSIANTESATASSVFDCGETAKCYYSFYGKTSSGNTTCSSYIQGSADNSSWTNLKTLAHASDPTVKTGNVSGYRYYRTYQGAAGGSHVTACYSTATFVKYY